MIPRHHGKRGANGKRRSDQRSQGGPHSRYDSVTPAMTAEAADVTADDIVVNAMRPSWRS